MKTYDVKRFRRQFFGERAAHDFVFWILEKTPVVITGHARPVFGSSQFFIDDRNVQIRWIAANR